MSIWDINFALMVMAGFIGYGFGAKGRKKREKLNGTGRCIEGAPPQKAGKR